MAKDTWMVVPCYNEADRLDGGAFLAAVAESDTTTFLFVDDGSTDGTRELLSSIEARGGGRCRTLILPENRGKAEAVRRGMNAAMEGGAHYTGYWDADLATPLGVIPEFVGILDRQPDIEIVMGARARMLGRHIQRSGFRHLVGRAYATVASLALRLPVYDTQCGAKLFRTTETLRLALEEPFGSRWAFDVELLRRLQVEWGDSGLDRIVEVPLRQWRDVRDSKVSWLSGLAALLFIVRMAVSRRAS